MQQGVVKGYGVRLKVFIFKDKLSILEMENLRQKI